MVVKWPWLRDFMRRGLAFWSHCAINIIIKLKRPKYWSFKIPQIQQWHIKFAQVHEETEHDFIFTHFTKNLERLIFLMFPCLHPLEDGLCHLQCPWVSSRSSQHFGWTKREGDTVNRGYDKCLVRVPNKSLAEGNRNRWQQWLEGNISKRGATSPGTWISLVHGTIMTIDDY